MTCTVPPVNPVAHPMRRFVRSTRRAYALKRRFALAFLAVVPQLAAAAQDACTAQGQADQDRIVREFSSQRPARGDKDAELTWSRNLNAALAAAAKRAEDCARANKPAVSATAAAKEQECIAEASRRTAELDKRYGGRTLSAQEQTARRSEENRLLEDRMSCITRAKR